MTTRIYVNDSPGIDKASVTQVTSRLSGGGFGRSTREDMLLDLMDAAAVVPFFTASGAVVSRGIVGPGFDIVESELGINGSKRKKKRIVDFFNYISPLQSNVKDIYGPLAKLYTTAFSFRMFGHSAWEILREPSTGRPLGFDVIPGVLKPNIAVNGEFKKPAYIQYLRVNGVDSKFEFNDPENIVFFAVPDYSGGIFMSELLSLSEYTLPSEIYAAVAYRSLHENRDAPYSGFWYVPADTDDDTFKRFSAMITARYTGSGNYGRNPIIMRGEGGFKPITTTSDDAPYLDGRRVNWDEIFATTGVPGAKHGIDNSSVDLKELRREFYESTIRPVTSLIEESIYRNICIRLFDAPEWKLKIRRPDFTTAVEDASIELRRIQWGQWSPNEARASRGEEPRDGGDYYLIPANMDVAKDGKPGRPDNDPVDDGAGDMEPADEDTVPGTQPPEVVEESIDDIVNELRKWKRFAMRVAAGKRFEREFIAESIPVDLYEFVLLQFYKCDGDPIRVAELFDNIIDDVQALWK